MHRIRKRKAIPQSQSILIDDAVPTMLSIVLLLLCIQCLKYTYEITIYFYFPVQQSHFTSIRRYVTLQLKIRYENDGKIEISISIKARSETFSIIPPPTIKYTFAIRN